MKAAAYLRVSSAAQSYAMQEAAILQAVATRGDELLERYSEKASAKVNARPERERLLQDAKLGQFGRLYVYRLDRLSRGGIRDVLDVVERLTRYNVELVTLTDGFDLKGPAAEIILAVLAWASKFERQAINERIASARARIVAEGKSWGRPSRLSDVDVTKVQALREKGHTLRYIAQAMHVPKSTVARALSHKVKLETTSTGLVRPKVIRSPSR